MKKEEELKKKVRFFALQNAIKFKGKAQPGAVVGKIIKENPEIKSKLKEYMPVISKLINEVNSLDIDKQQAEFDKLKKEVLIKQPDQKTKTTMFTMFNISPGEHIRTAFPPGVEKYPHIGHAKACLLNYMLAKEHNGEFVLRLEDTNPLLVKKEYYDSIIEDLKWLGIEWNEICYASDYMDTFYSDAEKLINKGLAYMCFCKPEEIKNNRREGIECKCRSASIENNLRSWKALLNEKTTSSAAQGVLRLKIDLKHKNSAMRDPIIFRVINATHARQGTKYKVWPTYDFETSVMDGVNRITHRLRSKEFELRNELQRYIQEKLGYPTTIIKEFARFKMEGVETSGRVIREKIQKGEMLGWDDPRLITLKALRRRGFTAEAIKNFVIATGISKSESTVTWDDLIMQNRRILDNTANRYFAITDPVKIQITNAPSQDIELDLNPNIKQGGRKFSTTHKFIISRRDLESFKEGELIRLADCLNFLYKDKKFEFHSLSYEEFKNKGNKIIHWLVDDDNNLDITVLMPDTKKLTGKAEPGISREKEGSHVQFVRFGFCRLDRVNKSNNSFDFWYTHN